MKKFTQSALVLILLSVLLFTACAQIGTDNESGEGGEVTPDDAEMEDLITEKLEGNHKFDFILSKSKTREEWSKTLDRMIGYGAKISPEEKEIIIDWLVSRNE